MNQTAAIEILERFLSRSPRRALEVQIAVGDELWQWRHGEAVRGQILERLAMDETALDDSSYQPQ